jgi:hypothetical protein
MNQEHEKFFSDINTLCSKICWGIVAGEGTGSTIALDFGEKIPRKKKILNPTLTDEQKKYTAELSLFISCAWRIESDNKVICGSTDPNANDGPMVRGLKNLVDHKVDSIHVLLPSFDLSLLFDGFLWLRVFCDQTGEVEEYDNYSFFSSDRIYTIKARSVLTWEQRR